MRCFKCSTEIPEDAEVCAGCGMRVMRIRTEPAVTRQPMDATAPAAAVTAGGVVASHLLFAGFWLRAVAYAIDAVVIGVLAAPILFFALPQGAHLREEFGKLSPTEMFNMATPEVRSVMVVALPVVLAVGWLYYAFCESSSWQATLGKRLLGLTVTDLEGRPIGFGRASGRFFGKLISGQLFGIGYYLAGFTRRKQALHDLMARCLVLRRR